MTAALWLAARAGAYLLVLQACGAFLFLALLAPRSGPEAQALRRRVRALAAGAAIACLLQLLSEPAYMAGEAAGLWDPDLWRTVLHGRAALVPAVRVLGLAGIFLAARSGARAPGIAAVAVVLVSFLLTGHTTMAAPRPLLALLLGVHVLVVGFWLGALWPLQRLVRTLPDAALRVLLERVSRLAAPAVALLALAGVAMACLLLPGPGALLRPYGLLLCVKGLLFAVLLALAALNRQRLTPRIAVVGVRAALARSIATEYAVMVLVLGVTAALTGWYSPGGP
jgi:putative copper export protein